MLLLKDKHLEIRAHPSLLQAELDNPKPDIYITTSRETQTARNTAGSTEPPSPPPPPSSPTMAAESQSQSQPLPLPEPTVPRKPFSSYKLLSFDIYGTLIDWERGILDHLQPLVARIPDDAPAEILQYRDPANQIKLAAKFNEVEAPLQAERPEARYSDILTEAYLRLAREWGLVLDDNNNNTPPDSSSVHQEAAAFGASIGSWPAFPDTVDAMRRLRQHYRFLVPLSNVDRASFAGTQTGPLAGVEFYDVYTAQDIGSYKPDLRNFEYLLTHAREDAGVDKPDILHVAQSLFHDHVPAKKVGLSSVWINRANAGMGSVGKGVKQLHDNGDVGYGWRFATLAEFADQVDKEFDEEQGKEK